MNQTRIKMDGTTTVILLAVILLFMLYWICSGLVAVLIWIAISTLKWVLWLFKPLRLAVIVSLIILAILLIG